MATAALAICGPSTGDSPAIGRVSMKSTALLCLTILARNSGLPNRRGLIVAGPQAYYD